MPLRVVIAEDAVLFRAGLVRLLEDRGHQVCAAVADGGALLLTVSDDGRGGADLALGSGLAGLAQRVAVVDGHLDVASPPGGPTRVTVTLPMRA